MLDFMLRGLPAMAERAISLTTKTCTHTSHNVADSSKDIPSSFLPYASRKSLKSVSIQHRDLAFAIQIESLLSVTTFGTPPICRPPRPDMFAPNNRTLCTCKNNGRKACSLCQTNDLIMVPHLQDPCPSLRVSISLREHEQIA